MSKKLRLLAPIYGLNYGKLKDLTLDRNSKIRWITKKESLLLRKSGFDPLKYNYLLDMVYRYNEKKINEPYPALQILLDKIEVSLRVFNTGVIGFAGIVSKPQVSPFPLRINLTIPNQQSSYKINNSKFSGFPDFCKKFRSAYHKKQIAIDWFNKSYSEFAPTNKIICYCVCFENLFVPSNSHEKKIFIIFGLNLLNINKSNRDEIDLLYNYRNSIIHADKKKQKELLRKIGSMSSFLEHCTETLREVLQIYIDKQW